MMSRKKTNRRQFERIVQHMKQDSDLAKGIRSIGAPKGETKSRWDDIALDLNCLGPPVRNGQEWQKVWIDMKGKVKKILKENKAEYEATNGNTKNIKHLSKLQLEINYLLGLAHAVDTSETETDEVTIDEVKPRLEDLEQLIGKARPFIEPFEAGTVDPLESNRAPRQSPGKSKAVDKRFALLEKQTKIQEETLKQFTEIQENTSEIATSLHKLVAIQEKRNLILEANLELKRRTLELKEKELRRVNSEEF